MVNANTSALPQLLSRRIEYGLFNAVTADEMLGFDFLDISFSLFVVEVLLVTGHDFLPLLHGGVVVAAKTSVVPQELSRLIA